METVGPLRQTVHSRVELSTSCLWVLKWFNSAGKSDAKNWWSVMPRSFNNFSSRTSSLLAPLPDATGFSSSLALLPDATGSSTIDWSPFSDIMRDVRLLEHSPSFFMAWFSVMPGETEDKKMGEKKPFNHSKIGSVAEWSKALV